MEFEKVYESVFNNSAKKSFNLNYLLNKYDNEVEELFKSTNDIEIVEESKIPKSDNIPYNDPKKWLKVDGITCLYVDLANSSVLDYKNYSKRVAQIYQGFTNTLVRTMNNFNASYIDIKGDGAFALFDNENSYIYALLAAITFRTYFEKSLKTVVDNKTNGKITLSFRSGITIGDVIFKRMGLRGDKKNEVWTNSTVNNCAKLTAFSEFNKILVSSDIYNKIKYNRYLTKSCGCNNGVKSENYRDLWEEKYYQELSSYGEATVYELGSFWCENCGENFINKIIDDYNLNLN